MNQALRKYMEAATGLTAVTKTQAERIVKQLVKQGEAARDQAGDLADELLERSRANREAVSGLVRHETQRAIRAMGLASQDEVERLEREVADLERRLEQATAQQGGAGKKATGKKATRKKATKKKSTKKATGAKRTSAKKKT